MINYYSTMEGYVDVVDVNSDVSVARYYAKENFAEVGWQHIDFVNNAIDTSLVNMDLLQVKSYPSRTHRQQMTSDGLLFIATNARIKSPYLMMRDEILKQSQLLRTKC